MSLYYENPEAVKIIFLRVGRTIDAKALVYFIRL